MNLKKLFYFRISVNTKPYLLLLVFREDRWSKNVNAENRRSLWLYLRTYWLCRRKIKAEALRLLKKYKIYTNSTYGHAHNRELIYPVLQWIGNETPAAVFAESFNMVKTLTCLIFSWLHALLLCTGSSKPRYRPSNYTLTALGRN